MADFNSSIVTQSSSQQEQKVMKRPKKCDEANKLIQLLLSSLYPLSGWIKELNQVIFLPVIT